MTSLIGYACNQPGFPEARQIETLTANGVKNIYVEGRGAESIEQAMKALRNGMMIATAGGYRPFGNNRKQIMARVALVEDKDKVIVDIETGKRSDKHGATLLDAALARLHHESSMPRPNQAVTMGRKGGNARGTAIRAKAKPREEAEVIWFDMRYPRDQDAAEACGYGWGKSKLWKEFGSSGRPQGKRPRNPVLPNRVGKIYFLRDKHRLVKIGFSIKPKGRLSTHASSNPNKLTLLGMIDGTMADEKAMHKQFHAQRIDPRREWFRIEGKLAKFLAKLPKSNI